MNYTKQIYCLFITLFFASPMAAQQPHSRWQKYVATSKAWLAKRCTRKNIAITSACTIGLAACGWKIWRSCNPTTPESVIIPAPTIAEQPYDSVTVAPHKDNPTPQIPAPQSDSSTQKADQSQTIQSSWTAKTLQRLKKWFNVNGPIDAPKKSVKMTTHRPVQIKQSERYDAAPIEEIQAPNINNDYPPSPVVTPQPIQPSPANDLAARRNNDIFINAEPRIISTPESRPVVELSDNSQDIHSQHKVPMRRQANIQPSRPQNVTIQQPPAENEAPIVPAAAPAMHNAPLNENNPQAASPAPENSAITHQPIQNVNAHADHAILPTPQENPQMPTTFTMSGSASKPASKKTSDQGRNNQLPVKPLTNEFDNSSQSPQSTPVPPQQRAIPISDNINDHRYSFSSTNPDGVYTQTTYSRKDGALLKIEWVHAHTGQRVTTYERANPS